MPLLDSVNIEDLPKKCSPVSDDREVLNDFALAVELVTDASIHVAFASRISTEISFCVDALEPLFQPQNLY
jgi:hypothetical protein